MKPTIWKIFARQPATLKDSREYARECYQADVIAVGWSSLGDLNAISSRYELGKELARKWGREAEGGAKTIGQWAGALWRFRTEVRKGDYVVCPDRDSGRYYVGIVRSKRVFYDESPMGGGCEFAHRRKVKWFPPLKRNQVLAIWPSGQFGGRQTVSKISGGQDRLIRRLKRRPRASSRGARLPTQPDMEWGKEAEARAMAWLREGGYSPENVTHLNLGWDISCGEFKFEVKGRKSGRTAIRLTENEWRASKRFGKRYTVLVFTASTKEALKRAVPKQIADPRDTELWSRRAVYEYVLVE